MIDPLLRMRHLNAFLETARLGSLSAAAEFMSISQPAVSKTIRELEEMMGVQLFDRSHRRLTLTKAGRVFQQHTGAAMLDLQKAQDLIRDTPVQKTRLKVGALPTASTELLPLAALKLRETAPHCLLRVTTGPNWLLYSQLREGALDMVIGRMPSAEHMEGLSFRQLYTEHIAAVVRPGHPLLSEELNGENLGKFPLMLPPQGAVIAPAVRSYLHELGITNPEPDFESVGYAFGKRLVCQSDTVWIISQGVVREELKTGALVSLSLQNELLGGPVGASVRTGALDNDEQRALLKVLIEVSGEVDFSSHL